MVLPPVPPDAQRAAAGLAVQFGWSDAVVACVAGRFADDPGLLEAASSGLQTGSEAFIALREAGVACQQALEWAPQFARTMDDANDGQLRDEQVACLGREWAQLDPAVIDELVTGAVVPEARSGGAVSAAEGIGERCGL